MMGNETLEMKQTMAAASYDIELTAEKSGDIITVTCTGGDPGPFLPNGTPAQRFKFTLKDSTGLNVKFASLDAADNCPNCPPPTGENSDQIVGVTMHNGTPPPLRNAAFTDNNNNDSKNGPIDVCYQWNFTCDDPSVTVKPFDPIIRNGGTP